MIGQFFDGALADYERRRAHDRPKTDPAPKSVSLTEQDLRIGMRVVVYNHELRQVTGRYTIESPIWTETSYVDAAYRNTKRVLVRNESGKLEPTSVGDMGLAPYESGAMNSANRTYRVVE